MKECTRLLFMIVATGALSGCATYYAISTDQITDQIKSGQNRQSRTQAIPIAPILLSNRYDANSIERILCLDARGDSVWLYPNKDTQLEITTKSGDVIKMYFDTVFLEGTKLKGLRSRLLKLEREVDLTEITKIEIYTELSKTERLRAE
jgi:hypothetical protein